MSDYYPSPTPEPRRENTGAAGDPPAVPAASHAAPQPAVSSEGPGYPVWSPSYYQAAPGYDPTAGQPTYGQPDASGQTTWLPPVTGQYPPAGPGYAYPPAPPSRSANGWRIGVAAAAAGGMLVAAAMGFGVGVLVTGSFSDEASVRTTGDGLPQSPSQSQQEGSDSLPQPGADSQGSLPEGAGPDSTAPDSTAPDSGGDLVIPGFGDIPGFGGPESQGQGGSGQSEQLSQAADAAADKVTPAVVNLDVEVGYGAGAGAGTGIVLTADGKVLTNAHVISGANEISGTVVGNGRTYPVTVLGYDKSRDVALVQLEGASGLQPAAIDDSDAVAMGDLVVGVGNAGGDGGEPTAVEGKVTEKGATITASDANGGDSETLHNLIGTDANIQSGQSGGPMVDADGEVVGMNTAAAMGGFSGAGQSTGYAIPINDALDIANQINEGKSSDSIHIGQTAFLGVQVAEGASQGVAVAGVVDGSAAAKAGLSEGDTILSIDGVAVTSPEGLSESIRDRNPGDTIAVTYTDSSGQRKSVEVTLGSGPAA